MIFLTLMQAKEYVIDMHDVVFWVSAITAILGLVFLVVKPIRKLLNDYNQALATTKKTLDSNTTAINNLSKIQKEQAECISSIKEDRQQLSVDIHKIQQALATMAKLELDKESSKALSRGYITRSRLRWLEDMYEIYSPFSTNGGVDNLLNRVRQLPIESE